MEWKTEIEQILAERRQQLGEPISLDEILDLHDALEGEGEMSDDARQALLERISADPEATAKLRQLLRFPQLNDDDQDADFLESGEANEPQAEDDAGLEQRWQAFRPRLGGTANAGNRVVSPDSAPATLEPQGGLRVWQLAASFLVGVAAMAAFQLWNSPQPSHQSLVNAQLVELSSDDAGTTYRGAQPELLASDSDGLYLSLTAFDIDNTGSFGLMLFGPSGRQILHRTGLRPFDRSRFSLTVARTQLDGDGSYRVELSQAGKTVASFEFELLIDAP